MGDSTRTQQRQAIRARLAGTLLRNLIIVVAVAVPARLGAAIDLAGPATTSGTSVARLGAHDGIRVARNGVLFGNPRRTKSPAELDVKKAWKATPEARKIKADGIRKGSAEYDILKNKAIKRIRKVLKQVAADGNHDCVIKSGSLESNPNGLTVTDITDEVVRELERADIDDKVSPQELDAGV